MAKIAQTKAEVVQLRERVAELEGLLEVARQTYAEQQEEIERLRPQPRNQKR